MLSSQLIQNSYTYNLLALAQGINQKLLKFFPDEISQLTGKKGQQVQNQSQFITIPKSQLNKVYLSLLAIRDRIQKQEALRFGKADEYNYLNNVWQRQKGCSEDLFDRIDSLNQTVSMIKLKNNKLILGEISERNNYWQNQQNKIRMQNAWSHPFHESMNRKISNLQIYCSQLQDKVYKSSIENEQINKKKAEVQKKAAIYKEKIKKMEKQYFQLAKKKAEVEKQIYLIEPKLRTKDIKNKSITNQLSQSIDLTNNKQNAKQEEQNHKYSQFISLLQQQNMESLRSSTNFENGELSNMRDRYRHAKNLMKRSTTYISPNASMDSIKSIKFERTNCKKLIIKK